MFGPMAWALAGYVTVCNALRWFIQRDLSCYALCLKKRGSVPYAMSIMIGLLG